MKYKLIKPFPNLKYNIGHIFTTPIVLKWESDTGPERNVSSPVSEEEIESLIKQGYLEKL